MNGYTNFRNRVKPGYKNSHYTAIEYIPGRKQEYIDIFSPTTSSEKPKSVEELKKRILRVIDKYQKP